MSDHKSTRSQNTCLNPYYYGALEVWKRLKWDLKPESFDSRRKLKGRKDIYLGKKAVILCNGPSLLKSDFSLLSEVFTFGLNKINLLFEKSDFRPSCIVAVNRFVIEQNKDFYNQTDLPLFLDSNGINFIKKRSNIVFLHSSLYPKFAQDCSISINQGGTVTFVALQLAFHMGFQKVALVGCDHDFSTKGEPNKVVLSERSDPNHFDPSYFAGGVKWQLPDLAKSEASYSSAMDNYTAFGRSIFNATEGGKLELFPRKSLQDFVEDR